MRKSKFILLPVLTLLYIGAVTTSCEGGIERYNIDAPDNIQQIADSIAEEKAKIDTGDTVYVTIANSIVGAEDCSTPWNGATSQWFAVPSNRLLHIDFINHGSEANNWNNWNLRLADASDDKVELFVIRSDAYGWGNGDFALSAMEHNYADLAAKAGIEDIWEYFRSVMDGARVEMEIDHSKTGNVYVTAPCMQQTEISWLKSTISRFQLPMMSMQLWFAMAAGLISRMHILLHQRFRLWRILKPFQ